MRLVNPAVLRWLVVGSLGKSFKKWSKKKPIDRKEKMTQSQGDRLIAAHINARELRKTAYRRTDLSDPETIASHKAAHQATFNLRNMFLSHGFGDEAKKLEPEIAKLEVRRDLGMRSLLRKKGKLSEALIGYNRRPKVEPPPSPEPPESPSMLSTKRAHSAHEQLHSWIKTGLGVTHHQFLNVAKEHMLAAKEHQKVGNWTQMWMHQREAKNLYTAAKNIKGKPKPDVSPERKAALHASSSASEMQRVVAERQKLGFPIHAETYSDLAKAHGKAENLLRSIDDHENAEFHASHRRQFERLHSMTKKVLPSADLAYQTEKLKGVGQV